MWKDFCPLCGARFEAELDTVLLDLIMKHIDDGTCQRNFRPPKIALLDIGQSELAAFIYNGEPR